MSHHLCCCVLGLQIRVNQVRRLQGDALVAGYLHDVAAVLQLRRLSDGSLEREIELPGLGSVRDFSGRREHSETFFTYTDFVTPGSFYRCPSC